MCYEVPSGKEMGFQFEEEVDEGINDPRYYRSQGGMQAIDVIEEFRLNFNLGNVVKYVLRSGKKTENPVRDLRKALWYLKRELHAQETKENIGTRD